MSSPNRRNDKRKLPPSPLNSIHRASKQSVHANRHNNNKEMVLAAVRHDGMALQHACETLQDDPEVVLAAVQQNGDALQYVSRRIRKHDKSVILAAVRQNGTALKHVPKRFQEDSEVCLAALAALPPDVEMQEVLSCISRDLRDDRTFLLEAGSTIREFSYDHFLNFASERLRDDQKFLLEAIDRFSKGNSALKYASARLRDDDEVVRRAIEDNPKALCYASLRLRDDVEIATTVLTSTKSHGRASANARFLGNQSYVLAAIEKSKERWKVLEKASKELQDNRQVVLTAIRQDGNALRFASKRLRDDEEVVKEAVQRCGAMFELASERLQNDKGLALEAMESFGVLDTFQMLPMSLHSDHDILRHVKPEVIKAFRSVGAVDIEFTELPLELRGDRDVAKAAIVHDAAFEPGMLGHMSVQLRNDKGLFRKAVRRQRQLLADEKPKQGNHVLDFASLDVRRSLEIAEIERWPSRFADLPPELQRDRNLARWAVSKDGMHFKLLPDSLRGDKVIVTLAVQQCGVLIELAAAPLKGDRDVALLAVEQDHRAFEFVGDNLKADYDIALRVVTQNGLSIRHVHETLKRDRTLALAAVTQNDQAFWHLEDSFLEDREFVLAASRQGCDCLRLLSDSFRADREIVEAAVAVNGMAISYAAESLKADKELGLLAVEQDGLSIQFLAQPLRADKEIALVAVTEDGLSIKFLEDSLKVYREIIVAAVRQNFLCFSCVPPGEEGYQDAALQAARVNILITQHLREPLKSMLQNDPVVVERAIQDLDPMGGYCGDYMRIDFWHVCVGLDFKRKFRSTLERLQEHFGCSADSATLPTREVIYQMRRIAREKIWTLGQLSLPRQPACLPPEVRRLIMCYAGIPEEISTAKNAEYFAPVIASYAGAGFSWSKLQRRPYSEPEVVVIYVD